MVIFLKYIDRWMCVQELLVELVRLFLTAHNVPHTFLAALDKLDSVARFTIIRFPNFNGFNFTETRTKPRTVAQLAAQIKILLKAVRRFFRTQYFGVPEATFVQNIKKVLDIFQLCVG